MQTYKKNYVPSARNFFITAINCVLLISRLNDTFLIKQFQLRMERDVIEFESYFDVCLIDTSSNIF